MCTASQFAAHNSFARHLAYRGLQLPPAWKHTPWVSKSLHRIWAAGTHRHHVIHASEPQCVELRRSTFNRITQSTQMQLQYCYYDTILPYTCKLTQQLAQHISSAPSHNPRMSANCQKLRHSQHLKYHLNDSESNEATHIIHIHIPAVIE